MLTYLSVQRHTILNRNIQIPKWCAAVCTYFHFYDQHGIIDEIMRTYDIPRTSLMRAIDKILERFDNSQSFIENRKLKELEKKNDELCKKLKKEQSYVKGLEKQIENMEKEVQEQKVKLILFSAVINNSTRDIAELVFTVFGKRISHMTIARILNSFEKKAENLMERYFNVGIKSGCLDEIFFHGRPILVIVEALSHCIVALKKVSTLSTVEWTELINSLPFLERSINDKGIYICSSLKENGILYQLDSFHCMATFQKAFRKLEKKTYALITQEDVLKKKIKNLRPYSYNNGKKVALSRKLNEVRKEFEKAAEVYDLVEWIMKEIRESFAWIQPNGKINTSENFKERLSVLSEWLKELCPDLFRQPIKYIDEPEVSTYLDDIHQKLNTIDTTNPYELSHTTITEYYARKWVTLNGKQKHFSRNIQLKDIFIQTVLQQGNDSQFIEEKIFEAFDSTHRASSAVENVNSRLRIYEHVKKHVNQPFLSLVALFNNMRIFKDGAKRQGKSPAQLLKLELPANDFFGILKFA